MARALLTLGVGTHAEYLEMTRPTLVAYAERHGYVYHEAGVTDPGRPVSWSKVPHLWALLHDYDEVLWLDADVMIVEGSQDVAAQVPPAAWQALVAHHTHRGLVMGELPNAGVWLVRRPMRAVLDTLWGMTDYIDVPWWENAALIELMGYQINGAARWPVVHRDCTELYRHTHFLPLWWNSLDYDNPDAGACFMHVPGVMPHEARVATLRRWAEWKGR